MPRHELTRQEMYNRVWAKPMSDVAQDFGISDVALKKICTKNHIPTPPRGYWARKEAGQVVKPPKLHATPKGISDKVYIFGSVSDLPQEVKDILQAERKSRQVRPKIDIKPLALVQSPHRTILATVNALRNAKPDKAGALSANSENHCGISVGVSCVERVISILDALVCRLEDRGLILKPLGKNMSVSLDDYSFNFSIVEAIQKQKHVPTPEELLKEERIKKKEERDRYTPNWSFFNRERAYPEFDYIRTGELSVEIEHQYVGANGMRRNWRDRASRTIESQLDEIVSGMVAYIAAVKAQRLEWARRDLRWKRDARIRELTQKYAQREEKRLSHFTQLQENSNKITSFQAFIAQLACASKTDESVLQMLDWARNHVEKLKENLSHQAIAKHLQKEKLFSERDDIIDELEKLQSEQSDSRPSEINLADG